MYGLSCSNVSIRYEVLKWDWSKNMKPYV